jgi:hypothetical protein
MVLRNRFSYIIQNAANAFVLATANDGMQDWWIPDEEWWVSYLKQGILQTLQCKQSTLWDLKKVSILQRQVFMPIRSIDCDFVFCGGAPLLQHTDWTVGVAVGGEGCWSPGMK